jgi:hypothetical protein
MLPVMIVLLELTAVLVVCIALLGIATHFSAQRLKVAYARRPSGQGSMNSTSSQYSAASQSDGFSSTDQAAQAAALASSWQPR